jgi:hypothetical protein
MLAKIVGGTWKLIGFSAALTNMLRSTTGATFCYVQRTVIQHASCCLFSRTFSLVLFFLVSIECDTTTTRQQASKTQRAAAWPHLKPRI